MDFEFIEPSYSDPLLLGIPVETKPIAIKTEPNPLLVEVDAGHYGELLSAAGYKKANKNFDSVSPLSTADILIKTEPPPTPEHHHADEPSIKCVAYEMNGNANDDNQDIFVQNFSIKSELFFDENHSSNGLESNVEKPSSSKSRRRPEKKAKQSTSAAKTNSSMDNFECPTCRKVFPKRFKLKKHMKIHEPRTKMYECAHCDCKCFNRKDVRKHMWTHIKEKTFECYVCRVAFDSRKPMMEHMISVHCNGDTIFGATNIFICCFCSRTFKRKRDVEDHERKSHSVERLKCSACEKEFKSLPGLRGHIERFHTNNFVKRPEPRPCKICGKMLSSTSALTEHLKRHSSQRPYVCDQCGDSFKFPTCLKIHQRIHTGEKPFKCKFCPVHFAHEGTRRKHEMIHKAVNPHSCPYCDKKFRNSSDMKSHIQIHTKQWKFKCPLCGQGYARSGDFKRHLERHKNSEISK